jgi:hypothetical protein
MSMRRIVVAVFVALLPLPFLFGSPAIGAAPSPVGPKKFVKPISGTVAVDPTQHPTGPSTAALQAATRSGVRPSAIRPSLGTAGCSDRSARNVRANQECTNQSAAGFFGRGQSQNETAVAVNPTNPRNVVIAQNDYRQGDSACGVDSTLDSGRHWGSLVAPTNFGRGFAGGARHYWATAGDPSVAFDSTGTAYLMCLVFNRGFPTHEEGDHTPFGSSGFMVFRSTDGGASWSFPGDYVATTPGAARGGLGLLDKVYMAVDANPRSRFRDRLYAAWVQYPADFSTAPIFFGFSDDHGGTWHQTGSINGFSPALCPVQFGTDPPGTCNNSQFPDPFVAPNGDVYVTFINGNNCHGGIPGCPNPARDNHFQILIVKSTDGGTSFGPPVKVGDYNDVPDCLTYTGDNAGSACIPTAPLSPRSIFRAANYPSGVALSSRRIVVDYGSYINRHSKPTASRRGHCVPDGFSATTGLPLYQGVGVVDGCNNDIVVSISTNGGASFSGTSVPVSSLPSRNDEGRHLADQWFQWTARTPQGVSISSYYDRKYGDDQSSGFMDFTLAVGVAGAHVRVTDRSLPPSNEFPGTSGFSTFLGDYNGLAVGRDGAVHPAWPDTRNPIFTFDLSGDARQRVFAGFGADIYTASLHPSG